MNKNQVVAIIVTCSIAIVVAIVLFVLKPWEGPASAETYTLTVVVSPSEAGSVSPSSGEYEPGVQVTLMASPASGYTFDHWSGSASNTTSTVTIIMDSNKSLIANFQAITQTYTLTTNVGPSGAGSVSPSGGEYESGEQVTLTASPASGYTFDHWSGSASGITSGITITMDSNKSVTANFKTITYTLTTSISPSGAGSVSPSGGEYYPGVQITLAARPASGYAFDHWSGGASGNTSKIIVTMDSDKDITAYFGTEVSPPTDTYTLTTHVSPSGAGSVSPSGGEYESGVHVILTANPASGYTFDHWGGSASGSTSTITVTMDSDKDITAYFETEVSPPTDTYTLITDVSPSGAGSVSPSGGEYESDEQVTLTANPAGGYTFDYWSGDASGTTSSIVITMDSDKSLTAHFETTPPVPGVLFSDDFGDENGVWDIFSDEDGSVFYENGWLHLINQTLAPLATITRAHQYFTDFILEVETELVGGSEDNWHNIACRYQDDANYYDLAISADGYYSISKWVDGNQEDLLSAAPSSHIKTGTNAVNLVRIECISSSLRLSVNGYLVGEATDTTFSGGDIALGASSLVDLDGFTEIAFDNIVVSEP